MGAVVSGVEALARTVSSKPDTTEFTMRLISLILASVSVFCQTTVKTDQVRTTPASTARLLAADATGKIFVVELGAGLTISGGRIVLVPASTVDQTIAVETLKPDVNGNYPARPGAVYVRNGLVQSETVDYSITLATLRPILPWSSDDAILAITIKPITRQLSAPTAGAP
jgi:hypothetical protein